MPKPCLRRAEHRTASPLETIAQFNPGGEQVVSLVSFPGHSRQPNKHRADADIRSKSRCSIWYPTCDILRWRLDGPTLMPISIPIPIQSRSKSISSFSTRPPVAIVKSFRRFRWWQKVVDDAEEEHLSDLANLSLPFASRQRDSISAAGSNHT